MLEFKTLFNIEGHSGATRLVLLIGSWAIKIPYTKYGAYENTGVVAFLKGLLANIQETTFSKMNDPRYCPVIFSLPFGFLNIMRRAKPLEKELTEQEYRDFITDKDGYKMPVEDKKCSFGILDGKLVAIDYGS